MELTNVVKEQIDRMSYEDMLRKWRFAPLGDPLFESGDAYEYFIRAMESKKEKVGSSGAVRASKNIGWEKK